ncbi:unconventional myosin-XIX-like [Lingula anatina]|uniref:Unconventional myosin-XIX-like n=1 Tax=Lingula anatina TaxID=7574 RepID=A0A1S3H0P9_LINAN|nr:unconventional myosin-XIX-like [Lingula anatina]|eukprot:XP_013379051.1 unconventional myosin-XIX-like [Lingula anatina]
MFFIITSLADCNVSLDLASKLLGVDPSVLEKALTFRRIAASHSRRQSVFHKPCNEQEGRSRRDCLSKTLYSRLFDWLVSFINGCIKTKELYSFIGLLDIYGFESFINNSLEQLCINYANERLQQHFVAHFLKELQAEYVKEALPWTHTDFVDNRPCVELLDGSLGIFSLLIEECNLNRPSSVKMICDRIFTSARSHRHFQQPKKDLENPWFAVKHYAGTVQYQVSGLVDKNKDNVPAELVDMLKNSDNDFIASLFADFETDQPGRKKKTVLAKFKSSLDALMKTLNSTECLYIRCIKPNQHCEAGHFDGQYVITQLEACGVMETVEISRNGYPARIPYDKFVQKFGIIIKSEPTHLVSLSSQSESDRDTEKENDLLFDPLDKLFKKQLSLLDTPKKSGTPKKKLRRRTGLSSSDHTRKCCASVMKIVFGFQPNLSKQFGRTKLFLQDGQLEQLEAARCKLLSRYAFTIQCAWRRYQCKKRKSILKIQAVMRGWLVRRKWQKTLDAVRTIQAAWKLCKAKRVQAMCSQTGAITDIEKTSPKTPEEQMVSQNTNNVHSYSVREWRPCDKDVRHENMLPSPRLVKSLQDLSLSVGLPRLSHVETQDGIVSFRRMPRVHIKFHTKPNKVLKYAHFISQKEFLCSLTDCLPQYDPV